MALEEKSLAMPGATTTTTSCSRNWSELSDFLADRGGAQKCYVDTGPILERDYAAEAGIGWHGKSTMLVDPKLGTWFFLAEILTTLELPPDAPQPARCGTCTRCITACPTGAITDAHRLDARRCISYLTIELKGFDSSGAAAADRRSHLRLRRLPGRLPLEPFRGGLARGRLRRATRDRHVVA